MLYRCTEEYVFFIADEKELDEYRHLKDTLDSSNIAYEEELNSKYAVITLKKPNWRMV